METRALAALLITVLNSAAQQIEESIAGDGDDNDDAAPARSKAKARAPDASRRSDDKAAASARARAKNDEDEDDDSADTAAPDADDVVDAVRAALKVIDRAAVSKILKKHGKAEKASEVAEENRQAVIDAIEKAIDAAA